MVTSCLCLALYSEYNVGIVANCVCVHVYLCDVCRCMCECAYICVCVDFRIKDGITFGSN